MKKGFTLIELLAVIIILAILMIIAVPNILSTLSTARSSSFITQAQSIYKSVEKQYIIDSMMGTGTSCYDSSNLDLGSISSTLSFVVNVDEEEGSINNITVIDTGQQLKAYGTDINGISLQTYSEATITCSGYSVPYKEKLLHGTDPVLGSGMIPVIVSSSGSNWTVKRADITKRWYKYGKREWANAVILVDNPTHDANSDGVYEVGETIHHDDISAYFVWIPKYKYKLFNMGNYETKTSDAYTQRNQLIEIQFGIDNTTDSETSCATPMESGASGNCAVGKWMSHPSFITFNKTGFWVGKFDTTGTNNSSTEITSITVLPGTSILRNVVLKEMFIKAYNYNRISDSHMMKNTEWGAVAYLTNSNYGRGNTEVWYNNNTNAITGCVGSSVNETKIASCQNEWYTSIGLNGSTTGNITGIYDMRGGTYNIMASYVDGVFGSSTLTTSDISGKEKYFDVYNSLSTTTTFNYRILGDATGEMGPFANATSLNGWYQDYSTFVTSEKPWVQRGGYYSSSNSEGTGLFNFHQTTGVNSAAYGFRLILTP